MFEANFGKEEYLSGFRLIEKGNLHTEVSVSEEEVKIPLPEELYEKVKGKRVVIVPKG